MKTVLITGAAGFIGSHLVDRFLNDGYHVIAVDNFLTGNADNLKAHASQANFQFIEHDICRPLTLPTLKENLFAVLHFASPASPVGYMQHPLETLAVGSEGTKVALEIAEAHRARFLLASTSEVYGDPQVHPQTESYWGHVNPIGPRSVYDESKRFAEAITMAYHRTRGVDTHIVRIFNTYGPRMQLNDGRAIPAFLSQALQGEDLTVFGDGSQTRSFCYVSDLVEGLVRLLLSDMHEPVNLGNPNEMTVLELAEGIKKLVGTRGKIVFKPLPTDDPKVRRPDISKARALLKWEPKVSFTDGITRTLEYFRSLC